ncbi:MAG: bifunctional enoyl-CoA hydratase/phosphate acetyltransferase [Phaeobacter gallaeciensis]
MQYFESKTFDQITPGDSAELTRALRDDDIGPYVDMPEGSNAAAPDDGIAAGAWGSALISELLSTELPGPGTVCLTQSLRFLAPARLGEMITTRITVRETDPETRHVMLDCLCTDSADAALVEGTAEVIAPDKPLRVPRSGRPSGQLSKPGAGFDALIAATQPLDPIVTAVVHPCDVASLEGALEARDKALITPVLIGPAPRIKAAASEAGLDLAGIEIVHAPHSHAAADMAVSLVRTGKAEALMKGALHTDEVMSAVVNKATGLRTERRMSHVFVLDVPSYPKPLMITDAAINIFPDLLTKADILQNAIDLAQALGVAAPKVAILSAVETITPKIPSTVEAAGLCKMAERGQITGGILDGPLAFDNAISRAAAQAKGIASDVAGDADILLAPDLEAGNMISKQLQYLAGAEAAGLVLGARVPIMLTSRADGALARVASAALAQLFVRHQQARIAP